MVEKFLPTNPEDLLDLQTTIRRIARVSLSKTPHDCNTYTIPQITLPLRESDVITSAILAETAEDPFACAIGQRLLAPKPKVSQNNRTDMSAADIAIAIEAMNNTSPLF